jgi:hypothetical protein
VPVQTSRTVIPQFAHILSISGDLRPEEESWKARLFVSYFSLLGKPDEALATVSALLDKQPKDVPGLTLKGDLVASRPEDRTIQAWMLYSQASGIVYKNDPHPKEAPSELLIKQRAMFVKLLAGSKK